MNRVKKERERGRERESRKGDSRSLKFLKIVVFNNLNC
jgi:hypothetical protein